MSANNASLYDKNVTMAYVTVVPNEDKGFSFYYTLDAEGKPRKIGNFSTQQDVRVYSTVNASWVPILAAAKGWPENRAVSVEGPDGLIPVELPPLGPGEVWAAYTPDNLPDGVTLPNATDQANDISKARRRVWIDSGDVTLNEFKGGKDLANTYDLLGFKKVPDSEADNGAPPPVKKADPGYGALAVLAFIVFFMLTGEDR